MIKAIMACDEDGGVGLNGKLPWPHIPLDYQWFMDRTFGGVLIIGRSTWDDPQLSHPMPDRISYVVTSRPESCPEAYGHLSEDLLNAIQELDNTYPDKTIWIIGGVNLIEQTLGIIEQFYLSRISGTYENDRFLPIDELNRWNVSWEEVHSEVVFQILENPSVK